MGKFVSAKSDSTIPTYKECREAATCPLVAESATCQEVSLNDLVERLLDCRGFLWDILLDGEWTHCSRRLVRSLVDVFGSEDVSKAFGEEHKQGD
ncbi:MAG: hypothetical protein C0609_00160 [Deltaproteobacteria bacterium]|nr:MAG: hypothetical protein C0609_00160 [Deltaproteobacteria bacterium]